MKKIYDVAIIGGGLSGLLLAKRCAKQGYEVVICEAQDQIGGRCRIDTPVENMHVPYGWNINLLTPQMRQTFDLDVDLLEIKNTPPRTYQHKTWREITASELSPEQKFYDLKDFTIAQDLLGQIPAGSDPKITLETSQPISDCKMESLLLMEVSNSQKSYTAKTFVMACPSETLLKIIPKEKFHQKFLNACQKQESVMAVKLDFITNRRFCELQNILMSLEPIGVGIISSNLSPVYVPKGYEMTQWLFFLTPEELAIKEETTKKIRAGKRFLKKAFGETYFDHVIWERIAVIPHVFSKKPIVLPPEWTSLKNLFWISDELGCPCPEGNPAICNIVPTFEKIQAFLKNF